MQIFKMAEEKVEWMDGKRVIKILGFVAIIFTCMPWIAADYWWIRIFDYPHLQLTIFTALTLIALFIKFDFNDFRDYFFAGLLLLCFSYQFVKIFPYTAFAPLEMQDASTEYRTDLSLFTANVLQKNKNCALVIEEMNRIDADIMLFTETDLPWKNEISKNLTPEYQYKKEYPLDNTYGMVLYSKLELINPEVKFMISDSIPSIHTKVVLRSNDTIQLYAIHPTPPMPQENPLSTDRDAEMMKIAMLTRASKLPVIVMGDFNDVAWSSSSQLFQRTSQLLDPRIGRGFYSTFNAKSRLMRWPLDHIFISDKFRFLEMKNTEKIDSDHFPMYVKLSYEPELAAQQAIEPATKEELEMAQKQINKEKREPTN